MQKLMTMSPRPSTQRYYAISDLARDLRSVGASYDQVYSYIRRAGIKRYKLPTTGKTRYILASDAEKVREDFTHPENHAEEVK